jgi:ribonuclease P protein component
LIISSLKTQKYFDLVNKQGIKLHSSYFLLVLAKNYSHIAENLHGEVSLGMKVSRKLGNAVIRNKIKRRIRHLLSLISKNLDQSSKLGLILIPKKGFEKLDFALIANEFKKLLDSKGLIS